MKWAVSDYVLHSSSHLSAIQKYWLRFYRFEDLLQRRAMRPYKEKKKDFSKKEFWRVKSMLGYLVLLIKYS